MEHEIQYVARHVAIHFLRQGGFDEGADALAAEDPAAVERLRKIIQEGVDAWSTKYRVFALHHDAFFWDLKPKRIQDPVNGDLVKFEWGWNADVEGAASPSVTSSAGGAYDLMVALAEIFTPDGATEPQPPAEPEYPEPKYSPLTEAFFTTFHEDGRAMMAALGDERGGCSLQEVKAWRQSGRPTPPLSHKYVSYAADEVEVCSVCGHWYRTGNRTDDFPTRVCGGAPLQEFQSVHLYDPRRSVILREAQRVDRLVACMTKLGAKDWEIHPFQRMLAQVVGKLEPKDLERYTKERVGLSKERA